jgi:hypothetical protein
MHDVKKLTAEQYLRIAEEAAKRSPAPPRPPPGFGGFEQAGLDVIAVVLRNVIRRNRKAGEQ